MPQFFSRWAAARIQVALVTTKDEEKGASIVMQLSAVQMSGQLTQHQFPLFLIRANFTAISLRFAEWR